MVDYLEFVDDALLGAAFQTAPLGPATLIRATQVPSTPNGVVLHVHGYNDYFFQAHLASAFIEAGYVFYAVDLRAAGRSLQPDQVPHFVTDLRQQASDISAASQYLRATHPDLPLVLHAHSTGGLTTSLWAHAHRHGQDLLRGPDALVLNSPFLQPRLSKAAQATVSPVLTRMGPLKPLLELSHKPSYYAQSLLRENGGEWEFDTTLKRPEGLPVRSGWLVAITRAQERVTRGLAINCPVLLAASTASSKDAPDNPLVRTTDTILNVKHIVAMAPRLSRQTEVLRVMDGIHDLSLSNPEARQFYLSNAFEWILRSVPAAG